MDNGEGGLPYGVIDLNDGEQRSNLNIRDVIDAISAADPDAAAALEDAMARPPAPHGGPFVRIVEQPAGKAMRYNGRHFQYDRKLLYRFRYECEGRSAGSIPGVNSAADRKTYPTIEICGHTGKAIIVVSCVTREEPYKPHPHNLVGRERCKSGVCTVKQDLRDSSLISFSNLGIQCVKRRDIVEALRVREGLRVDPFRTGFAHMHQPQSIDLNAVRLCFQVFLQDEAGAMRHSLQPVVSDVIYDRKAVSELQILRISRPSGSAKGGTEVILLCEKVTREDISVVLYENGPGGAGGPAVWEESANVIIVHKQVAIAFTTPPYRNPHTGDHREVFIQLKRVSDNGRSNSIPFTYIPEYQDTEYLKRKRQKTLTILQQLEQEKAWGQEQKPIKAEPSDKGSPRHMGSSPLRYTPLEQVQDIPYQQWIQEPLQGASTMTSPPYYTPQDVAWAGPSYPQPGPNMQPMQSRSPNMLVNMPVTSPNMHAMSPNLVTSPNMQITSNMQPMSPNVQVLHNVQVVSPGQAMSPQGQMMSPQGQVMSPQGQVMSPQGQVMSPHMMDMDRQCGMSPVMVTSPNNMGHVSPNVVHQSMAQQQQQQMEGIPSLSGLLTQDGGAGLQFNSGDLSNLSALLGQAYRSNDLSDSLNRLSTGDLYPVDL